MPTSFNNFPSIREMTGQRLQQPVTPKQSPQKLGGVSFEEMLHRKTAPTSGELKFSKHANLRMESRNIDLSQDQLDRLQGGVERAGEKGIKESLVMVDDMAFIVNINSNTVITAVGEGDDKIFTNIDGAVIV